MSYTYSTTHLREALVTIELLRNRATELGRDIAETQKRRWEDDELERSRYSETLEVRRENILTAISCIQDEICDAV
jgi:hypothetical protein